MASRKNGQFGLQMPESYYFYTVCVFNVFRLDILGSFEQKKVVYQNRLEFYLNLLAICKTSFEFFS